MNYYTNEKNTLLLISLLKKYNVKRIVASPGATNVSFVASCQHDNFFEIYSSVDERSAAFIACGMAQETNEPVVLSCTGATASRNYIPGLTKAYYDKLPIIAVTSTINEGKIGFYIPQLIDRRQQFSDLVNESYHLDSIFSKENEEIAVTRINYYLYKTIVKKEGPLHINLATNYSYNFSIKKLPNCRKISYFDDLINLPSLPVGKIGIFIGNHLPFNEEETSIIDQFCSCYNAIVICDKTSNFHGKYGFQAALSNYQEKKSSSYAFDLVIHIGYVSGGYIPFQAKQIWRVNPDGEYRDTYGKLTAVFELEECSFFKHYLKEGISRDELLRECQSERKKLIQKIPQLPFSNIAIAKELSNKLPNGSVLHLGILNSLRAWNFFDLDKSISVYCNTGGFGIDGCLSSAVGTATFRTEKKHFIVLGDLAFFYDINILLQVKPNNLHILVINNGLGCEFKNYNHRAAIFGIETNEYIAAAGHNSNKSINLIKNFAFDNNLDYYRAENLRDFLNKSELWLKSERLSILEVFTKDSDESQALKIVNTLSPSIKIRTIKLFKKIIKKILHR